MRSILKLLAKINLAIIYGEVGRQHEALQLTKQVVEVSRRTLGEEHPKTSDSIHNLGVLYSKAGRHQEALEQVRS